MNKCFLCIFLLICLAGFFIFPQISYASEYELSEIQANNILNSCQQKLIDEWIDITCSSDFSEPEKQAALFLIRNGIQKKELAYWLEQVPKEYLKTLIKTGAFLLFNPDISEILNKIEKETVKQAVKIAKDWLLQNEIKIANGPLKYSYISYKGNIQEPNFHYILSYHYLNNNKSEIIIEFYSPERVEPQKTTSSMLWVGRSSWDLEDWLKKGNEKLDPFTVKVKGKVDDFYGGYVWDESSKVEVIFSEQVPEYPFEPEPTSFWGKIKKAIENEVSGTVQDFKDVFNVFSEIKKEISNLTGFEAKVSQPLSITVPEETVQEEKLKEVEQKIVDAQEEIAEVMSLDNGNPEVLQGDSLDGLQEQLDDIADILDVLNTKLGKIIQARVKYDSEKSDKEDKEEVDDEIEKEEDENEEIEEDLDQGIPVVLCQINQSDSPLQNKIIFNEIAWMGTNISANDEWIELKNISNQEINLSGWQILDKDEQIRIIFQQEGAISKVLSDGFYILERTDDDSVPDIIADFIYNGALNNKDEALYLFDQNCNLQDKVKTDSTWPAGDKSSKRTMERKNNLEWQTSANINGTPKAKNSRGYFEASGGGGSGGGSEPESTLDEEPEEEPEESEELERQEYLFQDVVINEIAWAGTKASAQDEWIELYNNRGQEISIYNWKLKSSDGSPDIVFENSLSTTTISNDGFYLIERTDDNPISDIPGDWLGSFGYGLSNSQCEILSLYDHHNNLIDTTTCSEDGFWLAGKASPDYISMERIDPKLSGSDPNNWQNNNGLITNGLDAENQPIQGTPKARNSVCQSIEFANGFWPMFGNNPKNTNQSQNIGPKTNNVRWLIDIGDVVSKSAWTSSQPIIGKDETIYIAASSYEDGDGQLFAFNSDGTTKWVFDLENLPGTPATDADGNVYIGTIETDNSDGKILAIDFHGNKKWEFTQAGARFITLSEHGILYFSSGKVIYALDPENGELVWRYESENRWFSQPAIGQDNMLYAVFPGWWNGQDHEKGALYAFDSETGALKWTALHRLWWNMSAPVIDSQGNIYTGGDELFAFNPDGNLKWKQLLAPSQPNWIRQIRTSWLAITSDNTIIAGGRGTYGGNPYYILRTYNLEGEMLLEFQPEEKPTQNDENPGGNIIQWYSQPILDSQGNIFTYGMTFDDPARYSRLYSIDKDTGIINWHYDLNWWQTFLSIPAIGDDNHLYIAYLHEEKDEKQIKLIAFGLKEQDSEEIDQDFSQSPWQMFGNNARHTNVSSFFGPEKQELEKEIFIGEEESDDYYGPCVISQNNDFYLPARIERNTGIYAINSQGNKKWFYEAPDIGMTYTWPAIGSNGLVYFMSKNGLIAVDDFGRFKWKFNLDYMFTVTSPVVGGHGIVYMATFYKQGDDYDNALFAIDESGQELWRKSFGYDTHLREISSPAIGLDGTIYVGNRNILYALNSDGSEKWSLELRELYRLAESLTTPIVSNDGIIFVRANGLNAVSQDGQLLWSLDYDGLYPRALSPDENILYATFHPSWGGGGTVWGRLYAINTLTGEIIWEKGFQNNPLDAITVDAKGNIYIHYGTRKGIIGLDENGEEIFSKTTERFRNSFTLGKDKTIYIPGHYSIYTISPE